MQTLMFLGRRKGVRLRMHSTMGMTMLKVHGDLHILRDTSNLSASLVKQVLRSKHVAPLSVNAATESLQSMYVFCVP
jgi:hypothetical protein